MLKAHLRYEQFSGQLGAEVTLECLHRGPASAMLPYDPQRDEVLLVKQFRIGAYMERQRAEEGWTLEVPAGICSAGDDPRQTAQREMLEETGYAPLALEPIMEYLISPGFTSERIFLYLALVDLQRPEQAGGGLDHENEDIALIRVDFTTAMAMVSDGRINSATPILALQWLAQNRHRLRG
uniref:ADP-ribose pyrophosphatase n=1 Tax=Magnetococcus massalia (strain MO-1) TaxID=451514 RepID=A0A1S7LLI7_MAGMO|nr:putative ADP-ribose pyrophosphatase(nudF, Synonyms: aspP) [Candidatus Magnetococcus massalia]